MVRLDPAFSPATSSVVRLETLDEDFPPARSISSFIWFRESFSSTPVMAPVTTTVIPSSGRSAAASPSAAPSASSSPGSGGGVAPGSAMLTRAATSFSISGASSTSSATTAAAFSLPMPSTCWSASASAARIRSMVAK